MMTSLDYLTNKVLSLDAKALDLLKNIPDTLLSIEITDLSLTFFMEFKQGKIYYLKHTTKSPQVTMQGPLRAFVSLTRSKDPKRAVQLGLNIEGDLTTGNVIRNILLSLNPDWEELLSTLTGDTLANEIGTFARNTQLKKKQFLNHLTISIREYLQEESKFTPHPEEMNDFLADIDDLRDDVERLELRILKLQEKREMA